jgi:hypothetical protein
MADADDVHHPALALPHVVEIDSDGFDFRVGDKGFVWSYPSAYRASRGSSAPTSRCCSSVTRPRSKHSCSVNPRSSSPPPATTSFRWWSPTRGGGQVRRGLGRAPRSDT